MKRLSNGEARWWRCLIAVVLGLAGLVPAWGQTGYPYFPLKTGTSITYQVFDISGLFHPDTQEIDVLQRTYKPNNDQSLRFSETTDQLFFGGGPLYVMEYYANEKTLGTLTEAGWISRDGRDYIGEAINQHGNVHIPPIGLLAKSPVEGEVIDETSQVYQGNGSREFLQTLPWTTKTIRHYDTWGKFEDVWRTGLWEHNDRVTDKNGQLVSGAKDMVYNYVFQKDVGIVNFWYGVRDPQTNAVTGYEFYAISHQ